jgi:hypothetical protein
MNSSGKIIIAIFMALLATALTGDRQVGIGFNKECIDGIDNGGGPGIDWNDFNCNDYPYADGLGETYSPYIYTSSKYQYSMWDYDYQYRGVSDTEWCDPLTYSGYISSYQTLTSLSGGKDTAEGDYHAWYAANCP